VSGEQARLHASTLAYLLIRIQLNEIYTGRPVFPQVSPRASSERGARTRPKLAAKRMEID